MGRHMRLMISYSRDDSNFVYELVRAMREEGHTVWIDTGLTGGLSWWQGICEGIESAEIVIAMLSPRAVGSIYCMAELDYALALNKPVLPLMIKHCEVYPKPLEERLIQYHNIQDMLMDKILLRCEQAFGKISLRMRDGEFAIPNPPPQRPPKPEAAPSAPKDPFALFAAAEEAAASGDAVIAEKLFNAVIKLDPSGLGLAATERLAEIKHERLRTSNYLAVVKMVSNPALTRGAQAAWKAFVAKYGTDYDPQGVAEKLSAAALPQLPLTEAEEETPATAEAPIEVPPAIVIAQQFKRGLKYQNSGNLDGAIEAYSQVLQLSPEHAEAYNNRGLAKRAKGDLEGALADYTAAIRYNGQYAEAYNNRGVVHFEQKNYSAAAGDYTRAIDLGHPELYLPYNNRGLARFHRKDYPGAIEDCTQAIRLQPQYANAYYNRGLARADNGDLDAALTDFGEAIRLSPKYAAAYVSRGNARKAKNDVNGALADYGEAVRINPSYANAYYNRSSLYNAIGDLPNAIADSEKYLEVAANAPDRAEVAAWIDKARKQLGLSGG